MNKQSILNQAKKLRSLLEQTIYHFAPIMDKALLKGQPYIFDFTSANIELIKIDLRDTDAFTDYIFETMERAGCQLGIGKYNEDRTIYNRSPLFTSEGEARSVHLGIDLWAPVGTPVYAPLTGAVQSFQINDHFGDYGPTIILAHKLNGINFYTLYGHLSQKSLNDLRLGQKIKLGQMIATLGNNQENGNWPPHLHFQIISDMLGKAGDFPAVARPAEKNYYLTVCPDPNLILRIPF